MKDADYLISKTARAELKDHKKKAYIKKRYAADTPLDHPAVPYFIMVFSFIVDGSILYSLFQKISYDAPFLIGVGLGTLLFGLDFLPSYIGMHLRRLQQGLAKDWFAFWFGFGAFLLACAVNVTLRILTISLLTPSGAGTDPGAIAMTVFSICGPFITSIGAFYVSYLCYHPLRIRKRMAEELLAEKTDEFRRTDAILQEYDTNDPELLREYDTRSYELSDRMQITKAISHYDYYVQQLKEYLATPATTSALSQENCLALIERFQRERAALAGALVNTEAAEVPATSEHEQSGSNHAV